MPEKKREMVVHTHEQVHVAAGWIWDCIEEEFFEGWMEFENGRIVAMGRGSIPPSTPLFRGIILPRFINYHTHLGDSVFAEKVRPLVSSMPLHEVVAPPHGLKHRLLAATAKEEIVRGIVQSLLKMVSTGTGGFFDFREGGIQGIQYMQEALSTPLADTGITHAPPSGGFTFQEILHPFILGRPPSLAATSSQLESLLVTAEGIGLSAYTDWEHDDFFAVAEETHRAGKMFAVHVSEEFHEPLDEILKAHPDMLVHMIYSTPEEWHILAESDIPVVCCPRANALFGLRPPIEGMMQAGVGVLLGTDNAMFVDPDMLAEVRYVFHHYRYFRNKGKRGFRKCIGMALPLTETLVNTVPCTPMEEGETADFQVISFLEGSDYAHPEHMLADSGDGGARGPAVGGLVLENCIIEFQRVG